MPDPLWPNVRPGDPSTAITAAQYNARNAEIERRARLVVGGGLRLSDGSGGRALGLDRPAAFWARLYGDETPYGFAEVASNPDGTVAPMEGGFQGFAPEGGPVAHEVNGVANLDQMVGWLVPDSQGDWRFQHLAAGAGGGPRPPCTHPVTVTVTQACRGNLEGIAVVIRSRATNAVAASGTTGADGTADFLIGPGAYKVEVDYEGYSGAAPTFTSMGGDRIFVDGTCRNGLFFGLQTFVHVAYPTTSFRVRANGCDGPLPGTLVTLYWGIGTSRIEVGAGTTGDDGWADLELDRGIPRFAALVARFEYPGDMFGVLEREFVLDGVAIACEIGGTLPVKFPYGCCGRGSRIGGLPLPPELHATVGGHAVTLRRDFEGATSGPWRGVFTASVPGRDYNLVTHPDGTIDRQPFCGMPYPAPVEDLVEVAFLVEWQCGGLTVIYAACSASTLAPGRAIRSTWEELRDYWLKSPGYTRVLQSDFEHYTGDPLVYEGTISGAPYFNGPWVVTE